MSQNIDQSHIYTVGELAVTREHVPPNTTVSAVYDIFSDAPTLEALAIVEEGRPLGLITRTKLLFKLSRRFGYELHAKHPITTVADMTPLVVCEDELLDSVIEKACARQPADVYDEVVVAGTCGEYLGLLSLKELVIQQSIALTRSVLQQELASARSEELERVNKVKSQFLANVTHELRSPVNAIVGLTHLLKMSADSGSIEQIRERLGFLMSTASNLRTVITNILDMSKIEAGKMEVARKEVDIVPLLREIVETTQILIREKPIEVILSLPVDRLEVTTDEIKLRQVLMNLAGNAAKFTEQGRIEIKLTAGGASVEIAVVDTGIGIKDEDLEQLFGSFSQIEDPHTKSREGTGLGLAISSHLAQLLGGSIAVRSRYGEGTQFTLTLPR